MPPSKIGYQVKVNVSGVDYEATGNSFAEALAKIKFGKINGRAVISIGKNGKEKSFVYNRPRFQMLLHRKVYQEVLAKNAEMFIQ